MNHCYRQQKQSYLHVSFLVLLFLFTGCANHQPQHRAEHKTVEQHTPATQQRFSDIDKWLSIFEGDQRDAYQKPDIVVNTMKIQPGDVIADLGAGTGYFTRRFAVATGPGGKALGLDVEESMVDHMNSEAKTLGLPNYEARLVGYHDPGLASQSVDIIFLCNTYHHIENRVAYFSNVTQSLKEGGRIVIVDFYKNTDFGPPRDHKLAKSVVLDEMEKAGYRLLKDLKVLPEQYYLEYGL